MPIPLRRKYMELMIKAKKQEQEELDKLNKNSRFKN